MRLFLLVLLVLVAFAANSVLTRAALAAETIGPGAFMAIRTGSGAVMLLTLALAAHGADCLKRAFGWATAAALALYMVGFSYAYVQLETGTGALLLFGGVQITMFAGALVLGERPGLARWAGSALGLLGLAVLFLPGAQAPALLPALLMGAAAIGWGVFSLIGRGGGQALPRTAVAFVLATPPVVALWLVAPAGPPISTAGALLAMASGALASGCGYALWYAVLPKLEASVAALSQLTVPLIALVGGIVFVGEPATIRFALAACLILGGVGAGIFWGQRR